MRRRAMTRLALLSIFACALSGKSFAAGQPSASEVRAAADRVIPPIMQKYHIPGMAVAVRIHGESYFINYGVASRETRQRITSDTLFEIGSLSKTFTATLAVYAQIDGDLSLSDPTSKYLPALRGSGFDRVNLINLATHTSGGLPLQVPDDIHNTDQLMAYLKHRKPTSEPGTERIYSNVGIGVLGMIAAASMHRTFEDAIQKKLFPELGMTRSYINVPADAMKRYAQGYTREDKAVRVRPGVLDSEAYGVKSTSADMIRFVTANLRTTKPVGKLQRAIIETHTGYFTSGELMQDLIWEQYPYPVERKRLLAGNAPEMLFEPNRATKISPPLPPQANVLINKTGSTNGFGAYVAFVPAKKVGIAILANKSYPIDARVNAAFDILTQLEGRMP
jgi:beta-lactamase class C